MRFLVTGGAGFIGGHLCERLAAEGHEVVAVDNFASGRARTPVLERAGVEVVEADIRSAEASASLVDFRPEVLFHLAAQMDVRRSVADPIYDAKVNVIGLLRLLEAAKEVGARFIFTSSGGAMYGELADSQSAFTEDDYGIPTSPYGISKKVAGDYLQFYSDTQGLSFVNLAPANVYGPRQDPHGEAGVVAIFANALLTGERCVIYGDGKQTRDFVYIDDVVEALLAAVEGGEANTYNIGTEVETSVEDLYRQMAAIATVNLEPEYRPERPGEARRVCLNISKARRELGWEPKVALSEGLGRTIESFR